MILHNSAVLLSGLTAAPWCVAASNLFDASLTGIIDYLSKNHFCTTVQPLFNGAYLICIAPYRQSHCSAAVRIFNEQKYP